MQQLLKSSIQTPLAVTELIEEINQKEQTYQSGQPSKQRNEDKKVCLYPSLFQLGCGWRNQRQKRKKGNSVSTPVSSNSEVLNCARNKISSIQSPGKIVSAPAWTWKYQTVQEVARPPECRGFPECRFLGKSILAPWFELYGSKNQWHTFHRH